MKKVRQFPVLQTQAGDNAQLKKDICDAIDQGAYFFGMTTDENDGTFTLLASFDVDKAHFFALGMLARAGYVLNSNFDTE
jgi:hypothetical protein